VRHELTVIEHGMDEWHVYLWVLALGGRQGSKGAEAIPQAREHAMASIPSFRLWPSPWRIGRWEVVIAAIVAMTNAEAILVAIATIISGTVVAVFSVHVASAAIFTIAAWVDARNATVAAAVAVVSAATIVSAAAPTLTAAPDAAAAAATTTAAAIAVAIALAAAVPLAAAGAAAAALAAAATAATALATPALATPAPAATSIPLHVQLLIVIYGIWDEE
jgi:hypothetical protein